MTEHKVLTLDEYVDVLQRSKLLKKEQLFSILEEYRKLPEAEFTNCAHFARALEDGKLITEWQNQHLMEGRFGGFFLGHYKLFRLLGAGGMGAVYLAEHVMMHRKVAVKVLYVAQVEQTTLERFYQESRAVASLDHINIVRAHHFDTTDEFLYLVMEFVDGPDLQMLVRRYGPLPYWEAADYVRQAAAGLAHAHEAGVVHRDIKPANLLRDPKGLVKVLDLGVARMASREGSTTLTTVGNSMLGTVDYLAPEQAINSHTVDHRADIYALGCTLYFLLTGDPPFSEGTQAQRLLAHQIQAPPAIRNSRPDAPPELIRICDRMIAKNPKDRFQTGDEVRIALQQWLQQYRESNGMLNPIHPDQLTGNRSDDHGDTQDSVSTPTMHGKS